MVLYVKHTAGKKMQLIYNDRIITNDVIFGKLLEIYEIGFQLSCLVPFEDKWKLWTLESSIVLDFNAQIYFSLL